MADFFEPIWLIGSVGEVRVGRPKKKKKKKFGSHFYFSIGGIFIASVDPPSMESTYHGLGVSSLLS